MFRRLSCKVPAAKLRPTGDIHVCSYANAALQKAHSPKYQELREGEPAQRTLVDFDGPHVEICRLSVLGTNQASSVPDSLGYRMGEIVACRCPMCQLVGLPSHCDSVFSYSKTSWMGIWFIVQYLRNTCDHDCSDCFDLSLHSLNEDALFSSLFRNSANASAIEP